MTNKLQLMCMHSMRAPPLYCQCAPSFLATTSRRKYISFEGERGCLAGPTRRMLVTQVTGHSLHRLNWLRMLIPFKSIYRTHFLDISRKQRREGIGIQGPYFTNDTFYR